MLARRHGGFTLIELLIVLTVLVAVAGTVVLSLGSTEDDAKLELARSEMGTLRDACVRWKQDLGTFLPDPTVDFPSIFNGPTTGPTALQSFRTATDATGAAKYPVALTPLVALEIGVAAGSGAAGANLTAPNLTGASDTLPSPAPTVATDGTYTTIPYALGVFSIQPFSATGGASSTFASWNPTTRRGWRGPYAAFPDAIVSSEVSGGVSTLISTPVRVIVLAEGLGSATQGTFELADPWDRGGPNVSTSAHTWYSYALTRDPRDGTTGTPTYPPVGFTIKCYGPHPNGRPSLTNSVDSPSIVVSYP